MAQTVNDVADLMSDKTRRPSSNFQVPTALRYFFTVLVLGLLVLILIMGGKALRDAPPAAIHVDDRDLTVAQYQALQQVMNQQSVSSFFTSDLQALRDISTGLAWVDQVSVSRDWQRGIVIKALPKQAVANFGTERLVDAKGAVFVPADSRELTQEKFATLQGDIAQAPVIMQQMQQVNDWYAPLGMQVEDIILSPRMTWLIRFDNGLRIIVDNENTAQKLLNLSQLMGNQLENRRAEIQSVDLRYKNGFTIAWNIAPPQNTEISSKEKQPNDKSTKEQPL